MKTNDSDFAANSWLAGPGGTESEGLAVHSHFIDINITRVTLKIGQIFGAPRWMVKVFCHVEAAYSAPEVGDIIFPGSIRCFLSSETFLWRNYGGITLD